MCGIAGFIDNRLDRESFDRIAQLMLSSILHRGPDDSGIWIEGPIAIGHRRLSIIDLSSRGHQPMASPSGRYILAFNGEIYNHSTLRASQESCGKTFIGHSDTEILLSLIEDFGLKDALRQCLGMFAVAVWDRNNRTLQLARDRFGEKPLYFGWHSGCFLFGSELKALMEHPSFCKEVDIDSLSLLLKYGYIPSPKSIFKNTYKLQVGCILTLALPKLLSFPLSPNDCKQDLKNYWSIEDIVAKSLSSPYKGSFADASKDLEILLSNAVKIQMQADVPLGAFLSGGIDSSTIVALMQAQSAGRVKTFSIGFEDYDFDESRFARKVANHLGTDHEDVCVSPCDALDAIPLLPEMFDEPLADSSQIPTYLVAKIARKQVTVSLSGDGADELFCGYPRYAYGNLYARLPFRNLLLKPLGKVSWSIISNFARCFGPGHIHKLEPSMWALRHHLVTATSNQEIADILSKIYTESSRLFVKETKANSIYDLMGTKSLQMDYLQFAMLMDKWSYLPDDILVKVDRATMAVSLESRAPFLDHRVAEFVASLPINYLYDGHTHKKILREILYRHVPKVLVDRPKCGFSLPLASWLRDDLHEWAMDLLADDTCGELLNMQKCRELYLAHYEGQKDLSLVNWAILSFLSWAKRWL